MTKTPLDLDLDLSGLSQNDWLGRLDELGDAHGYFEQLGSKHFALYVGAGPKLLVTFETVESAQQNPGGRPRGFDFAIERLVASDLAVQRLHLVPRPGCL